MSRHYLRYTIPYFYRTEYKGPKDSVTLMGQPGIDGVSSVQAVIRKTVAGPITQYTWELFSLCDAGDQEKGNTVLITVAQSKPFPTQYEAAKDADQYIGRHHHTSVLTGDPKPAGESWIQRAHRLWREWEAMPATDPRGQQV